MTSLSKTCIVLTMTVNVLPNSSFQVDKVERINTYATSIKKWLAFTGFNIVVVENSGHTFDELKNELIMYSDRFEIVSFNQVEESNFKEDQMHLRSKGGLEIESIHYAFNKSSFIKNSTFVVKITGRFFVPFFNDYINSIDVENCDGLKQFFNFRCEIVGCHIKNFHSIFHRNLFVENEIYDYHVENVYEYRFSLYKNIITCPKFMIEPTQRGGLNEIYDSL